MCFALGAGCSSSTQGQKSVEGFEHTKDAVASAQVQVQRTISAMTALRAVPSNMLSEAFGRYKQSVADLEKEADQAKWRALSMKENADTQIQSWQSEMADIKDPQIKASLEKRREAIRDNYALLKMYADDARKAYEPFVQGNKQLIKALSIDLSPAAISGLSDSMDRITSEGMQLQQKLAAMQHALDNMSSGVSPIGAP